jgi:Flp pilus assembly protein TadD
MKYLNSGLLAALMLIAINGVSAETADLEAIKRLAAEGKQDAALQELDKRIADNAQDVEARFLRGLLLLERGEVKAARETFKALSQEFPGLPEPNNNLAALYAREGDYEKSREALLNAIASAPNYPVVRANLGDLYMNLAVEAYRAAVRLDPKDQASQAKLRLLEKMFASGG